MPNELITLPRQDQRIATVLQYHHMAGNAAAQMAVAAAICGLELKAIKKELGHGKWDDWFEENLGEAISLRTAQRYMALADGIKDKALKNDTVSFLPLLESAPSKLDDSQRARLAKSVAKVTDGATLAELYEVHGIVKKPQGSGAKGGAKGAPTKKAADADVIAEGRREQTHQLIEALNEALQDSIWNAADKPTRKTLHGLLIDAAAQVKETLA